jgi:fructose-1,6-bisphosphatase/inositol monophosphatase family enzyme
MVLQEEYKVMAQKIVNKIARVVRKAASTEFHKFGTNIGIGADGTPTKYVDKLAEDIALGLIARSKLKVNVLSEEAGFVDYKAPYTFVLDPVDGTRNAYRGIPFYSVSLGVGQKCLDDVEFGMVKNIPTGDTFCAEKGKGAFLNNNPIGAPDMPAPERLTSISLGKNAKPLTLKLAKKDTVRSYGCASLEMCMVAIGALDYYIIAQEYLRVTDIAASTLIVREAGGFVSNIKGIPLDMELTLHDRTSVIAACNEEIIKQIVST